MADRMPPYPMFSQSLPPNSLQQSQIPQQPPQAQQPDPQMISALSNPEHSRMWQQMNQLQNYRSQQSGDLTASQMNHQASAVSQLQDFARGQALSHGQGQPIVQQSFGLSAQRMNPPVFHDSQGGQPTSLIPSNFSNVPTNTQQQMKASFSMNPMMHGLNNPGVSRQLKMQEIARLQQSGLNVQHAANQPPNVEMFISSMQPSQDQLHGSPHPATSINPPGPNQGMAPGNVQQNAPKRITPAEFQERRTYLLNLIAQSENSMGALLQTARAGNAADPLVQHKLNQLRAEHAGRKELYTKFLTSYGAMMTQQVVNGIPPSNMSHINPMVHPLPQQSQATVPNTQAQPGFVTQANPVVTQYNIPGSGGPSPLPTQGQGALNQQLSVSAAQIGRPNTIPPRTGGTPHQVPGGQLPNTMSPNLGNFAAQSGQKVSNQSRQSPAIMPLDKPRFESTYIQFCRSQNMPPNLGVPIGENGVVDLHQLHVEVMHEDGGQSVILRDMWAVIGGRLGFVQFPGNDTEPARCGPVIAHQLQNIYNQYLLHFEQAYTLTVRNRSTTGSSQQPQQPGQSQQQMNSSPHTIGNNSTPSMSGNPTEMPSNPTRSLPNQQFVIAAARYAHMSVHDMRAQRVQENIIAFVERHRSELQRVYQQQLQMIARRNTEQEQQNAGNAQSHLPNMHEQSPMGLQLQRSMGANPVVNMPSGDAKVVNGSLVQENVAAALHRQPPTQDQIQQAMIMIGHIKQVFQQRLAGMTPSQIPDEQRLEYSPLLEQVHKMTSELDKKLPVYFAVFKSEDVIRRYVATVMTVARQRQLLSVSPPQYIINLPTLRTMQLQVHKLNEEFENRWRSMRAPAAPTSTPQHASLTSTPARLNASPLTVPPVQNAPQAVHPPSQSTGRPATTNPPLQPPPLQPSPSQTQLQPPPSHPQSNQSQLHPQQSHTNRKPFPSPIPPSPSAPPPPSTVASPTPPPAAASSSTPATSAPTPQTAAGSPQTPKSPPSKVKSRVANRNSRKLSTAGTAGKGPATPEAAPSIAGVKRPPEEDVATLTTVAPSEAEASNAPSPKKAKTEWEGEACEALVKKQQEVDSIKTDEDAAAFMDRMKELLAMTAPTDEEIHHDIASTLGQILAGVAQEPADAAATAAALSVHGAGDAGPPPTALSPHMGPAHDAFLEFIDFSSFTTLEDEDNDSKAPTPDLVPSSETNPSPESGSEGDLLGNSGSPDKSKTEESGDRSDPLRLGSLKEIDGGESAYYQLENWRWEGPMPTLDQPWAIFTS